MYSTGRQLLSTLHTYIQIQPLGLDMYKNGQKVKDDYVEGQESFMLDM